MLAGSLVVGVWVGDVDGAAVCWWLGLPVGSDEAVTRDGGALGDPVGDDGDGTAVGWTVGTKVNGRAPDGVELGGSVAGRPLGAADERAALGLLLGNTVGLKVVGRVDGLPVGLEVIGGLVRSTLTVGASVDGEMILIAGGWVGDSDPHPDPDTVIVYGPEASRNPSTSTVYLPIASTRVIIAARPHGPQSSQKSISSIDSS